MWPDKFGISVKLNSILSVQNLLAVGNSVSVSKGDIGHLAD